MDKVFEKTRELGEALLQSDAYLDMKQAEDRVARNPEASSLMADYVSHRLELQTMMQSDNPDPGAMKRLSDEMDEIQERLQLMDDVLEMTQARNEFNSLISQINQVLQFIVTGKIDDGAGCTGSCDTCPGCH